MKSKIPEITRKKIKEILPQLEEEALHKFIDITTYSKLNNKEIIIAEGNTTKKAFLILDGIIRGYVITNKGEEKTILLRGKGAFVAYPESAFNGEPSKYNFESVGITEALVFNVDTFQKLAEKETAIKNLYLYILKEVVSVLNYRVETMITMNNEERYIDLIKRNPDFLATAYKKDIACYLGITPVSLSRIIKRLKTTLINNC